jgi:hypothetical protein
MATAKIMMMMTMMSVFEGIIREFLKEAKLPQDWIQR